MDQLSHGRLDDLDRRWRQLESLVDVTPDIDPWCSGPDWVIPAHLAFAPDSEPAIFDEEGVGTALLARYDMGDNQTAIAGLEPLWGFASPILTADTRTMADYLTETLHHDEQWHWLVVPGLPPGDMAARLAGPFSSLGSVQARSGIIRQVADLNDGVDAWFGRRSAGFRKTIRQAERRASAAGVTFHDVTHDPEVFQRCVQIEAKSWKGSEDDGIISPSMQRFYELMTARLRGRGRLRALIAALDGEDVGYIFGGIRHGHYRGLQLSYAKHVRHLSISHLLQYRTILQLESEVGGVVDYDLGMDMEYKRRWADRSIRSITLVVERGGGGSH